MAPTFLKTIFEQIKAVMAGRQKWARHSDQEVIGYGVNLDGFSLNTN